jgi:hypothetical protein
LLATLEIPFKSRELIQLRDEVFIFRTAKGHMTIEPMTFYVNSILAPYVKSIHSQFSDESLDVSLVADKFGTHVNWVILTLLQRTGVVRIWFAPNSSHFLKPLDLAGFGSFKGICLTSGRSGSGRNIRVIAYLLII